jgi:hypothetical protein
MRLKNKCFVVLDFSYYWSSLLKIKEIKLS